jgi:hypothetical protein
MVRRRPGRLELLDVWGAMFAGGLVLWLIYVAMQ